MERPDPMKLPSIAAQRAILPPRRRRGIALLLAIFSMVVVGTTTVAYVASRETSTEVSRNAQVAADSRALAAAGLDLTSRIMRDSDSNWRTAHVNGRLLNNYSLDGGTVTVDLVDIQRRNAGQRPVSPMATTTEVEATITTTRNGSTWTTVAHQTIPSVARGQYAVYADSYIGLLGTNNQIGRWANSPLAAEKLRVYMATSATSAKAQTNANKLNGKGVNLKSGARFPLDVSGILAGDVRTQKSAWVYYPYNASSGTVWGEMLASIAAVRMEQNESVRLMAAPTEPLISGLHTRYTNAYVQNGVTATLTPFMVKASTLPQNNLRNWEVRGNSTITLTAGTYEVWGSWIMRDSRIIVQGDVKVTVNTNKKANGIDWRDSIVEVAPNATLEIHNGYSADITNCWVGAQYTCADEPNATKKVGDPHRKWWFNTFQSTACHVTAPASPQYIEPWRIRFYPVKSQMGSKYEWEITDSSIVGSIYLPDNPVNLNGRTVIWGRVAAEGVVFYDTSSLYYDHNLDLVTGLTEGATPPRTGDRDQLFPLRVVRYGFDADSGR